jgi:8-oxo-dGTP pyrophosphatase MutT (NUDIX family)
MRHGASAIISRLTESGEKEYLLIRANKDNGILSGKYYPPSGWVEIGEEDKDAVVRELKEELKLNIQPLRKIADFPGDLDDLMLHFWECEILSGEIEMDVVELNDVGWFTIKQMKEMALYPATIRLFKEFLKEEL